MLPEGTFFQSADGPLRVAVVGALAYGALIAMLRISGKRTLSKMSAFDLVVTVALGSTLSSILLSRDVALVEGLVALALLILLQFAVAWTSVRSAPLRSWIKADPTLLYHDGTFIDEAMMRQRVTHDEIMAGVRGAGHNDLSTVRSVVLEPDGSLSVIGAGP